MFSQYSWGDYFKFVAVIAFVYYAYVIIRYYREDIRDWISNRGQKDEPRPQEALSDEEDDLSSLYQVKEYASAKTPVAVTSPPPGSTKVPQPEPASKVDEEDYDTDDGIDLSGESVDDYAGNTFRLPVAIEPERPMEQSITEVQKAASQLETDEQGRVRPINPDDKSAARLAKVINQQRGATVFGDVNFNR